MSTIVVRNLPEHLHVLLKERARQNHRSMTREVIHLIEAGLANGGVEGAAPGASGVEAGSRLPQRVEAGAEASADAGTRVTADGRAALRAALIRQADGSLLNVLGIEDDAFFETLDLLRADTGAADDDTDFDEAEA